MSKVVQVLKPHRRQAREKTTSVTHTFANGGVFALPSDKDVEAAVFDAMEADTRNGVPFFLTEIPTPIFRMFLECTLAAPERVSSAEVAELVAVIHRAFVRFFPPTAVADSPRLFETIVLSARPRALCGSREVFEELMKVVPRIEVSDTVYLVDGRVRVGAVFYDDVAWHDPKPPDGAYQCVVEGDNVRLLTAGSPSFVNPRVHSALYKRVVRSGSAPEGAVRVSDELRRTGPWHHTSDTVFAVDDDTYFVNAMRDGQGRIEEQHRFVFPQIHVGVEQALYMREAVIDALASSTDGKPHRFAPLGWAHIVDNACYVGYNGAGVRMCGANLVSECVECRGRRVRDDDVKCGALGCNRGKIDEGRPLRLRGVYLDGAPDATLERHYAAKPRLVTERTAVRTIFKDPHPQWTCYDGCPKFGDMLKTVVKEDGERVYKIKGKEAIFKQDAKNGSSATEIVDREIFAVFEKHIRNRFVRQYRNLRVVGVRKSEKGVYFINVAGEGQHWCINLSPPADHDNNTIYFQCDREGICVRCRCTDPSPAGRCKGVCKDFKSTIKPLDAAEIALLFPEMQSKRATAASSSGVASKRSRVAA